MHPTFDERAEWFDAHYETTRGRIRLELLLERLHDTLPPPPARILDAGGGSGVVAVPLAERGYEVTILDTSARMLDIARERIAHAEVEVTARVGSIHEVRTVAPGPYDAICCHAVLMYVDEPGSSLEALRSVARVGTILSLLEKNREGLAVRPGLTGDYAEARRLLDDPIAAGNLGIPNRSRTLKEWSGLLADSGWQMDSHVGIRLFSDLAPDDLPADRHEQLLELEREAGRREPYRSVARLIHMSATAT